MNSNIGALSRSLSFHSTSATTLCLPFLYQTRTIIQPWREHCYRLSQSQNRNFATRQAQTDRPRQRGNRKLPYQLANRSAKALTDEKKAEARRKTKAEKAAELLEDETSTGKRVNAFTEILESQHSAPKMKRRFPSGRAVTMTQAEHEIFERLQNMTSKSQSIQEKPKSSDLFGKFPDDKSLATMFDDIADTLDKQKQTEIEKEEQEEQESIAQSAQAETDAKTKARSILLQSLQTRDVTLPLSGSLQPSLLQPGLDAADVEKMDQDRIDQRQELRELFSTVEHDTDLWHVLETHIFKEMRALDHVLNNERKQLATARLKVERKSHKGKDTTAAVQNLSQLESNSDRELLRKMTNIYGPALLYSIRLFRTGFPRSPYAMLLLPMIKKLGPMSYVLAGSTSFYNELLYIKWMYYRDLNGCANLIEEMISHNIHADQRTALVYEMASRTREEEIGINKPEQNRSAKSEQKDKLVAKKSDKIPTGTTFIPFGSPVKSFIAGWWQLQGNKAGWIRWTEAYDQLITMTRLEIQRKQDEQLLVDQRAGLLTEESMTESVDTNRSFVENQETAVGLLEPEIELLPSEDLSEPEVAIAG